MFLIFGLRTTARRLGPVSMTCPACRQHGGMLLVREVTKLTLFFIPLRPIRTRHVAYCTDPACRARVDVSAGEARRLLPSRLPSR
jgi:hypothetical protein